MLVTWRSKGLVKCGKSCVRDNLSRFENTGVMPPKGVDGRKRGRKFYIQSRQVDALNDEIRSAPGRTAGSENTGRALKRIKAGEASERGMSEKTVKSPSKRTAERYHYAAARATGDVSLSKKTIDKTDTRYAAETSLRCTACFISTVAYNHFVSNNGMDWEPPESLSDGANELHRMVEESIGVPMKPVKRHLVFSTDDTTEYVYEGVAKTGTGDKWRRIASSALNHRSRGARSGYSTGAGESCNGLRCKVTFSMSGGGTIAPICIRVAGLSEEELPSETCPAGMLIMEVEGLTASGAINPNDRGVGYVVLTRSSKGNDYSADERFFEWYYEHVFVRFVKDQRIRYDHWAEGTPVDDSLTAVSWNDGDIPQLAARHTKYMLVLYLENRIRTCKQNAARSGTEQAADLARVFPTIKVIQKKTTLRGQSSPLKDTLNAKFDMLYRDGKVRMKRMKLNALVDFISCTPEILLQACTPRNIQEGFLVNGMLDRGSKTHPDLNGMLNTYRGLLTKRDEHLVTSTFDRCYKEHYKRGRVPEPVLEELMFPMDYDSTGKVVRRDAGISQEHCQRSKSAWHPEQNAERDEFIDRDNTKIQERHAQQLEKIKLYFEWNEAVETSLQSQLGGSKSIKEATIEMFQKLRSKELIGFVHIRQFEDPSTTFKYPNKGTLKDATEGRKDDKTNTYKLVQLAYLQ